MVVLAAKIGLFKTWDALFAFTLDPHTNRLERGYCSRTILFAHLYNYNVVSSANSVSVKFLLQNGKLVPTSEE
jgi:hypothetical protein